MKPRVIDADGHVVERDQQIFKYLDPPFRGKEDLLNVAFFPSLDGWHRAARRVADGKGRGMPSPQAREWLAFLDEAGVEMSVLYPTGGLAYGLIEDQQWAIALARAYNTFLHTEFLSVAGGRLTGRA